MKLTSVGKVILGLLHERPRSGYEIKSFVDRSTRFFWAASYGQIYPELRRLEEAGLVEGASEPRGGRARRVFRATAAGRRALREWLTGPELAYELRDEGLLKLFFADALSDEEALALVRDLRRQRAARRLRFALSLDMVGRGRRFQLRSPHARPRRGIERDVLAAGRRRGVPLRFEPDSGSGNSDHRELELAGLPALAMQVWNAEDACYHTACDGWRRLQPGALARVQGIAESVLRER
jgi:DNA-binding PadR family transcriptional regulator